MDNQLITTTPNQMTERRPSPLEIAGHVANKHAETAVFDDYLSRRADNTIRTQTAALGAFSDYLAAAGLPGITADGLQRDPDCWRGVTWGIVEGFVKWLLSEGYAVGTVNHRLSTVKTYCKLASKAGVIAPNDYQLIKAVSGYGGKEARRVDERRPVTRRGRKKAEHISLTPEQASILKQHEDTPQGRRDALLMCLLLDHGLRVGEVADLQVTDFKLKAGELRFYRPKVDKEQTHRLTAATMRAAVAYLKKDAPALGQVLLGSTKDCRLTDEPMSARAMTKRVAYLGLHLLGIYKEKRIKVADTPAGPVYRTKKVGALSAHDCRHYWATDTARNGTDPFRLQEAGGWSSLAMPRRYVEAAAIANEGVILSG